MAKVVVLGIEGEEGLWVADLEAGTIVPMKDELHGDISAVADLRAKGLSTRKGVDFAVAVTPAAKVAASLHA